MPKIISIPTPCHKDWNEMSQREKGRHCDSCSKTVIDFTTWQPQEILFFFKKNKNICGRFTASQLNEPIPTQEDFVRELFYLPISTLKRVAAIFLFAFVIGASSCNNNHHTVGLIVEYPIKKNNITKQDNIVANTAHTILNDTTKKNLKTSNQLIVKPVKLDTKTNKANIVEPRMLMGEPAVVESHIMGDTIEMNTNKNKPTCKPILKNEENIIMGKIKMPTIDSSAKK
jgi:hypothetical protein